MPNESLTLKQLRGLNGLTQKQLAEKVGVVESTVSKWERGIAYPDVPKIELIEKALNVPYADINFYPFDTLKVYRNEKHLVN